MLAIIIETYPKIQIMMNMSFKRMIWAKRHRSCSIYQSQDRSFKEYKVTFIQAQFNWDFFTYALFFLFIDSQVLYGCQKYL